MNRNLRPTYSGVTATLALIVALSGGAYAVSALPRNSVGTAQLKSGAVTSTKVADRSLRGRDVAPNTIKIGNLTTDVQRRFQSPGIRYEWSGTATPGTPLNSLMTIPADSMVVGFSVTASLVGPAGCSDERVTVSATPSSSTEGAPITASYGDPVAVWDEAGGAQMLGIAYTTHAPGTLRATETCLSGSGEVDVNFDVEFAVMPMTSSGTVHGFG